MCSRHSFHPADRSAVRISTDLRLVGLVLVNGRNLTLRIRLGIIALCLAMGHFAVAEDPQVGTQKRSEAIPDAEQEEFFETKVRPLLSQHCIECHGAEDQSGELRLDQKGHFQQGGGSGPVVVAGDPNSSRLIQAVAYKNNDLQMPPETKLPEDAIAVLTDWVRAGAYWPDDRTADAVVTQMSAEEKVEMQRRSHWSFQPIVAVDPPTMDQLNARVSAQQRDAIDRPLKPIDRFVVSRLLDAGLQPNPKADRRTLIHRAHFTLLGLPPTYEEVQAFVEDDDPDAFVKLVDRLLENPHYGERWARHWLDIARYGDTKGYLAGNMETRYPYAFTFRDYVIDAFNSDKPFDQFVIEQVAADALELAGQEREALAAMGFLTVGRRFMNQPHDIIDDRIDVVTRGFLGMSVACARCHDHKYDPIPTADYYSLYGVFASSEEPSELPLLGEPTVSPEYEAFLKAKSEKQQEVDKWLEERRVQAEQELRSRVADYFVHIANSLPQYRKGKPSMQGKRGPLRPAAVRRWQQFLVQPTQSPEATWELMRQFAALPIEDYAGAATKLIDETVAGNTPDETKDKIPDRLLTALRNANPSSFPDVGQVFGDVLESVNSQWLEARKADQSVQQLADAGDEWLRQLLWADGAPTSLDREQAIAHLDQSERGRYNDLRNGVNGVDVTHPGAPPRGMVMVDRNRPVEPVIFRRGVPGNRGDNVPRRFLQVLSHVDGGKPFEQGSGRLELARAIANPANPLTARVIVNRIWQHQFGAGLVRTSSDFGTRGEPPTHPGLLDHLAAEFMADGWSIKRLQRRIMLSSTWQQSSEYRQDAAEADPENRLLWHLPRRRMEFEPLRDRLLVAAGRLDDHIGGRSVMIHEGATRRGLYAYIDREDLPGLLASFDLPSPDASRATRSKTTVPQQALYLMNSEFVIQQAKALADRTGGDSSDAAQRVRQLYRLALARDPDSDEAQAALAYVETPDSPNAWEQLAQVLLLCNEFAFVD